MVEVVPFLLSVQPYSFLSCSWSRVVDCCGCKALIAVVHRPLGLLNSQLLPEYPFLLTFVAKPLALFKSTLYNGNGASSILLPNPKSNQSYRLTVRGDNGSDYFDDITSNCGGYEHKK